ncbi:MAG: hypothetical protein L7S62_01825 [Flavobacteriales bacterium]|nr:hypothetical protein [Flavobacteriales bacterium]
MMTHAFQGGNNLLPLITLNQYTTFFDRTAHSTSGLEFLPKQQQFHRITRISLDQGHRFPGALFPIQANIKQLLASGGYVRRGIRFVHGCPPRLGAEDHAIIFQPNAGIIFLLSSHPDGEGNGEGCFNSFLLLGKIKENPYF